ncbi:MAG: biotin-dependent carboxyltransferase family protein [Flavobacteriaceae bacterium]|nr:biotin-dependent carboxyltransferase family protein [Flavobacteriaceae bacterium]
MLRVVNHGVYTSIQDLGRFQYREYGVPLSGAMDQYSAQLANLMAGNNENDAVLEVTFNGIFQFTRETILCISGADLHATLNNDILPCNYPVKVQKDSILKFTRPNYGARSYVAVKGGFLNKPILGSRSLFKEITAKYVLKNDDEIFYEPYYFDGNLAFSHVKINKDHFVSQFIEVFKGPEYDLLNKDQQNLLTKADFTISKEHNRMGYKLVETIENDLSSMLTSSMIPGTVQLTPSGTLIILMRDCGVTGGYPRILQLTDEAINRLAQKTTNDQITFKLVDLPT